MQQNQEDGSQEGVFIAKLGLFCNENQQGQYFLIIDLSQSRAYLYQESMVQTLSSDSIKFNKIQACAQTSKHLSTSISTPSLYPPNSGCFCSGQRTICPANASSFCPYIIIQSTYPLSMQSQPLIFPFFHPFEPALQEEVDCVCPKTPTRRPCSISEETISNSEKDQFEIELRDAFSPVKGEERPDVEVGKEKIKVSFFEFLEMRKLQNKRKRSM